MPTGITYCDETWDLTYGCKKRSPGCDKCWALRSLARMAGKNSGDRCLAAASAIERDESGKVDWVIGMDAVSLLKNELSKPLHWGQPRFVFVNSKSDLFDDRVLFSYIADAFHFMAETRRHRYMVLTKCPERMAEFIEWYRLNIDHRWPYPNVILMVSVEGPGQLHRAATLATIPAAMRGISFEPYLHEIDFATVDFAGIKWIVVGCEKLAGGWAGRWAGDQPRSWWNAVRRMVNACRTANVPIWVKQGPEKGDCSKPKVTDCLCEFPSGCQVQEKPQGLVV